MAWRSWGKALNEMLGQSLDLIRAGMEQHRNELQCQGEYLNSVAEHQKDWRKVMDNYFAVLNGINVNEKTERRKRTNEQHL